MESDAYVSRSGGASLLLMLAFTVSASVSHKHHAPAVLQACVVHRAACFVHSLCASHTASLLPCSICSAVHVLTLAPHPAVHG